MQSEIQQMVKLQTIDFIRNVGRKKTKAFAYRVPIGDYNNLQCTLNLLFRSAAKEEQERARNQRTNRMLIYMVLVFGVCWLPLNTINFLNDLDLFPIYCWQYYHFIFFVCHVMAMRQRVQLRKFRLYLDIELRKCMSNSILHIVKLRAVDRSTIQCWTFLSKGHST